MTVGRRLFDAHFHVIDARFPLVANQGYLPEPFPVDVYLETVKPLAVCGGAVVSGSFQAFDQTYLMAALERLGPNFVGVTQLPPDAADREILELARRGVRAVRFNLHRGGPQALDAIERMAQRVYAVAGWHVEVYPGATGLAELTPMLKKLPRVVIDHVGMSAANFPALLELVNAGMFVKASGFGRLSLDVPTALREIASINPEALVFGTDLPSTRAPAPFRPEDVDLVVDALGEERAYRVLYDNAVALYGLTPSPRPHSREPAAL